MQLRTNRNQGTPMYVCLCNRITDGEIRRHASAAVCTPGAVYRARGVAPRCGKCVPMLRSILQEALKSEPAVNSDSAALVAPAA
jgi:bacterioferritin-associated ferredoxin